jgi:hypothetical protein
MQLCSKIYCSLTALHVSSDVFAHHQENINYIYSFWYYSCMWLPAGVIDELEQSGHFLKYIMMHGTMNVKTKTSLKQIPCQWAEAILSENKLSKQSP